MVYGVLSLPCRIVTISIVQKPLIMSVLLLLLLFVYCVLHIQGQPVVTVSMCEPVAHNTSADTSKFDITLESSTCDIEVSVLIINTTYNYSYLHLQTIQ